MKIVEADLCFDGGTVSVVMQEGGTETRYEMDYSLPWDGRPRSVSVTVGGKTRYLAVGSDEESEICSNIKRRLEDKYGREAVRHALEVSEDREEAYAQWRADQEGPLVNPADWDDPHPLPFEGIWLRVFDFVEKAYRERKIRLD